MSKWREVWLLKGVQHTRVMMGVSGKTIEEAVEKAQAGLFLYIEHLDDGHVGFDWSETEAEVIEES
jgi:hypothetical protein